MAPRRARGIADCPQLFLYRQAAEAQRQACLEQRSGLQKLVGLDGACLALAP